MFLDWNPVSDLHYAYLIVISFLSSSFINISQADRQCQWISETNLHARWCSPIPTVVLIYNIHTLLVNLLYFHLLHQRHQLRIVACKCFNLFKKLSSHIDKHTAFFRFCFYSRCRCFFWSKQILWPQLYGAEEFWTHTNSSSFWSIWTSTVIPFTKRVLNYIAKRKKKTLDKCWNWLYYHQFAQIRIFFLFISVLCNLIQPPPVKITMIHCGFALKHVAHLLCNSVIFALCQVSGGFCFFILCFHPILCLHTHTFVMVEFPLKLFSFSLLWSGDWTVAH